MALALGKSVRQLLDEVDSRELSEWQAYEQVEPFGEIRADLRAGIVACTLANANRGKNTRPFSPRDFMPTFGDEAEAKPDVADQVRAVFGALRGQGGREHCRQLERGSIG